MKREIPFYFNKKITFVAMTVGGALLGALAHTIGFKSGEIIGMYRVNDLWCSMIDDAKKSPVSQKEEPERSGTNRSSN